MSDPFLLVGIMVYVIQSRGRIRLRLPASLWFGLFLALLSIFATALFPPNHNYIYERFEPTNVYAQFSTLTLHQSNSANAVKFVLVYLGMPLLIIAAGTTRKSLTTLLDGWIVGAALSSAVALSDAIHLTNISHALTGFSTADGRVAGLTTGANTLAEVIAMTLPALVIWSRQSVRRRRIAPIVFVLMFVALVMTGSRGGFVAALIGLLIGAMYDNSLRRKIPLAVGMVVGALVVVIAFVPSITNAALTVLRLNANNSTAIGSDFARQQVAAQANADFSQSPIHGIGVFAIQQGHQVELEFLAAGGVLLLIGWLCYVYGTIAILPRIKRHAKYSGWAPLAGSVAAWLASGLVENETLSRYLLIPVGFVCAVGYLCQQENLSDRPRLDLPPASRTHGYAAC